MAQTIIVLKLTNGTEVMCATDKHIVSFGIEKYRGKIPRKVFSTQDTPESKFKTGHMLAVTHMVELYFAPNVGTIFIPFYHSIPRFNPAMLGDSLNMHSNDVMGVNCVIQEAMLLNYRKLVGLTGLEQLAPINFPDQPQ